MSLKAVLASLDDVDEAVRPLYEEVDGKFALVLEGVDDHPAVANLRNAYRGEQDKRRKLGSEIDGMRRRLDLVPEDFDPEELARLRAEAESRKDDPDQKDRQKAIEAATTAIRTQLEAKASAEIKRRDERIVLLEETNTTMVKARHADYRERVLMGALEGVGVNNPARRRGAYALLAADVEIADEDGKLIARMRPELGGDSVDSYLRNWAQTEDGKAFVEPARGADATGGTGGARQTSRREGSMGGDRAERIKAIASRFPDLPKAG